VTLRRMALIMTALLAAVACGGGSGDGQTSTKSRLVVGLVQEPTTLDVTADATASIATVLRDNVYEGLVRMAANGKIVPELAKSWDVSPDGRVYTFHLVDARWQEGGAFTAQDVKFSWDRAADPNSKPVNPHLDYWGPVQSTDVVDDRTVRVTLKQHSESWLFHMAQGSAAILSAKSVAQNATHPIGTGPFKFQRWNKGDSITLVRNDDYWGTRAKLKEVVFRFISDANAMNNALKAGDIDVIGQVGGPEQIATFKSDSRFKVVQGAPRGKIMVAINNTRGPLRDVRVRRAVALAIDRKAWIDGVLAGYAAPIGSHAVPNASEPYYVDTTGVNPHDTAKAKQLLADAGYASGLTLHLAEISQFPYAVRGGDILGSELKEIGVTLQVDPMEFPRWLAGVFRPGGPQDYDLTIINHVEPRDIGNYANPKYYWHYDNPQVATMLAQADAEPDSAKRQALYAQVQRQLATDVANAFVMAPNDLAVIRANLHGYPTDQVAPSLRLGDAYFS
jgi:peptide/nickel transport system substrate-binding protein